MKNVAVYLADGATSTGLSDALAGILAGATDTPVKLGIRCSGDEAWGSTFKARIVSVGSSVGNGQLRIALDTDTLSPPWALSGLTGSGGGSWGSTGVRAAVVTAVNGTGETVASVEATVNVTDTGQTVTWSWTAVPGADSYNVYRRDFPSGDYGTPSLLGNTASLTMDDIGDTLGAGEPPAANTTAGAGPAYGTPPTLGYGPVTIGSLEIGQWAFFWVGRVVPGGTATRTFFAGCKFTEA